MGLRQLINFLLSSNFLPYFLNFISIQGCSFVIGLGLLRIFKPKVNGLAAIGIAVILGHFLIAAILMTLGYVLKAEVLTFTTLIIVFFMFLKFSRHVISYFKLLKYIPLLIIISSILFLVSSNAVYGGDTATYWGLASSFTRGNYPMTLPWQPNYLPVYHISTYILIGWYSSITGLSIPATHTLLSWVWITSYTILLLGILKANRFKKIFVLPLSLMILIIQGGPIFWRGDVFQLTSFFKLNDLLVRYESIKGSAGGGANSFSSLIYSNFQLLGLISVLSTISIITSIRTINIKLIILLGCLTSFIASTDESIFPPIFLCICIILLIKKKINYIILFMFVVLVTLMLFQNAIRDSILTPASPSRFSLVHPGSSDWFTRYNFSGGYISDSWYMFPLFVGLVFTCIYSIKKRHQQLFILTSFSSLCLLVGTIIKNTYWPANSVRLINTSSRISAITVILVLYMLLSSKKILVKYLSVFAIILVIPSVFTEYKYLSSFVTAKQHQNIITMSNTSSDELKLISDTIKYNDKVLILDQYPEDGVYSPLTINAIQFYGIQIPLFSARPKMMNAETGGEWYDAVSSLNPEVVKSLGIEYIFATPKGEKRMLANLSEYTLELITENKFGKLWKILNIPVNVTSPSIREGTEKIEAKKSVFIDKFTDPSIRRGLLEKLKKNEIYGKNYAIGGDWYMYREDELPVINNQTIWNNEDYLILSSENLKANPLQLEVMYTKIYTHPSFTIWKKEKIH